MVDRGEYLARLDGMTYGQNPREGFFRDELFLHPGMAFQLRYPAGWATQNQRSMVAAQSPKKDAIMALTVVEDAATPSAAARAFAAEEGIEGGRVTESEVNGLPAASFEFQATLQDGTLSGGAYFIQFDDSVFRVLGYSTTAGWSGYRTAFRASAESFDRLTDQTALNVQPLTLSIVTVDRDMTLAEFSRDFPSQVALDRLALLNRRSAEETVPAGTMLKRVVGGPLP